MWQITQLLPSKAPAGHPTPMPPHDLQDKTRRGPQKPDVGAVFLVETENTDRPKTRKKSVKGRSLSTVFGTPMHWDPSGRRVGTLLAVSWNRHPFKKSNECCEL
ncbi:MAG: hypothetical protein CM15mP68_4370 [Pseudomonadota bacterium]|nr:MAG: hypothetical protein CM15mP68_4370 [Pseudomonadota bacterium]